MARTPSNSRWRRVLLRGERGSMATEKALIVGTSSGAIVTASFPVVDKIEQGFQIVLSAMP